MARRKGPIAIGIGTFAFAIFLMFPARVAVHWFAPEQVQVNGISGSIWSGEVAQGSAGNVYFSDLKWTFKPLQLFLGKVAVDSNVNTRAGRISSTASVSITGTVKLADLNGNLVLSAIHPGFRSNRIDGTVKINMKFVELQNGFPGDALGSIDVENLVAGALGPDSLGDFHADITTSDAGILAEVKDKDNEASIDLEGNIMLSPNRDYQFIGNIGATGSTPPAIRQNLRFLGTPDANGQYPFRFEGSL